MSAEPARAYFGIGEVLAQLRGEFPDVSVSKIRFLESEGLIQPVRSPSGYRRFGMDDVARLRYILTAQRDHYLPLRVIRDRLDSAGGDAGARLPDQDGGTSSLLTRRQLMEAAGIDDAKLAELEEFGLVQRSGRHYRQEALDAARAAVALGGYGMHTRHLRAVQAAADRETSLIEQIVAPLLQQRSPGARDRAGQTAQEIAALALQLHAALVAEALRAAGFGDRAERAGA